MILFSGRVLLTRILLLILGLSVIYVSQSRIALAQITVSERKSTVGPKEKRRRGLDMLREIKKQIKKYYYDPNYRGIDIKARFKEAEENIKQMEHNWQIFREIAHLVLEFNDSHTKFYPPSRSTRVDYGFDMQMIGNYCFIVRVKKESDAEKKGLKPGFQVASIGEYGPTRKSLWKINYLVRSLDPMKSLPLTVVDLDGKKQTLSVDAKFTSLKERRETAKKKRKERKEKKKTAPPKAKEKPVEGVKRGTDYKCKEINPETVVCKLRTFSTERGEIKAMMAEANKHKNFILDLRGNGGGYVKIEQFLTGYFFDKKVKIGDFITRKYKEERFAKPIGAKGFKGNLIVLVDSRSASASEVFARTIQIEKRGKIMGDVSAGAVMTSYLMRLQVVRGTAGNQAVIPYVLNLTIGDLIMSDGKRLEDVGVVPDVLIGPNGQAISKKEDPVLAYAAREFGANVDGADTGKYGFLY